MNYKNVIFIQNFLIYMKRLNSKSYYIIDDNAWVIDYLYIYLEQLSLKCMLHKREHTLLVFLADSTKKEKHWC